MHLVLFDVDGTLVDSQHMIVASMDAAFAAVGRPAPSRAETLAVVGLSLDVAARRLLGPAVDAATVAALAEAYKTAYFELRRAGEPEPLYPGARDAIEALAARDDVLLGLATGKSMRGIRALLETHDLEGRFATLQSADGNPSKPDPTMIRVALAETGVAAADAVMLGDTVFDVAMARAAGVVAIGVSWGYHDADDLSRAGAEAVLDDFDRLVPTLARRFGW